MADGFSHDAHHASAPSPQRHYDARAGSHARGERFRDGVDVGAVYRDGEHHRDKARRADLRLTPRPGSVGRRMCPWSIVAPMNGSSTVTAAPSRSAASTSGVKWAAAV